MIAKAQEKSCPMCGGALHNGSTTYTVDLDSGVVVVRDVPATVCDQCGEEWIDNATAKLLEHIGDDARRKHCQFEVMTLKAA